MQPLRATMHAVRKTGQERCIEPVWKTRLVAFCVATTALTSSMLKASGFSQ